MSFRATIIFNHELYELDTKKNSFFFVVVYQN